MQRAQSPLEKFSSGLDTIRTTESNQETPPGILDYARSTSASKSQADQGILRPYGLSVSVPLQLCLCASLTWVRGRSVLHSALLYSRLSHHLTRPSSPSIRRISTAVRKRCCGSRYSLDPRMNNASTSSVHVSAASTESANGGNTTAGGATREAL